ncbi:MAG: RDD family protein [Desulfuromonadales bacterium]|nr:RDD family protein [Desulfuromonadales bacterium]
MKCPKCGYTSFDSLPKCKKCASDLSEHKQRLGLGSLLFPVGGGAPPVQEPLAFFTEADPDRSEIAVSPPAAASAPAFPSWEEQWSVASPPEAEEDAGAGSPGTADAEPDGELELFLDPFSPPDEAPSFAPFDDDLPELTEFGLESPLADDEDDFAFAPSVPADLGAEPEAEAGGQPWRAGCSVAGEEGSAALGFDADPLAPGTLPELPPLPAGDLPFGWSAAAPESAEELPPRSEHPSAQRLAEEVTPAAENGAGRPRLLSRWGAGLADLFILGLIFVIFVLAAEITLGGTRSIAASFIDLLAVYFLVLFCLCFGYFTLFHFLLGQTPGKMFFQLRVIGQEQEPLLFSQAFLRTTGGLLSLATAGLGYLLIFFDAQGRGWNDRLAGTRVISLAESKSVDRRVKERGAAAAEAG